MKFEVAVHRLGRLIQSNSTVILTALGVSGVVTTAVLSGRASFKAAHILAEEERVTAQPVPTKEAVKYVWKEYIPTFVSGGLTIGCIICGARISSKKTAAAYSLLTVSERAFNEYKEKVVEQIGINKEKAIKDEIAQDRVKETSGSAVVIVGAGNVLCFELHTGRYFYSDMEALRKAQNTINAKLIQEMDATLSDFYHLVGLPNTSYSYLSGWNCDKMMALEFSTTLSDDGRPCIAFDYNYIIPF